LGRTEEGLQGNFCSRLLCCEQARAVQMLAPGRAVDDRVKLLHGPHRAPRLAVGDRATSLFRDFLVVVNAWTDAPIRWPRGLPIGDRGHPSLVMVEELACAIRLAVHRCRRSWPGKKECLPEGFRASTSHKEVATATTRRTTWPWPFRRVGARFDG
jgi:hypothetical protein